MAVIAGVSHKGGAGRSVTLANVAYHLNKNSKAKTCLVDLDLASPTMGSILGLRKLAGGEVRTGTAQAPLSLYDILASGDAGANIPPGPTCLRKLAEEDTPLAGKLNVSPPLMFLPGYRGVGDWAGEISNLSQRLEHLIDNLTAMDAHVLLDVRSGSSDVLDALSQVQERRGTIDKVLIHVRWTPQHIEGLSSLLEHPRMRGFGEEHIRIIRTACWTPDTVTGPSRTFAENVDRTLRNRIREIRLAGKPLDLDDPDRFLAAIPDHQELRIKEEIITDDADPCYDAFRRLARRIHEDA